MTRAKALEPELDWAAAGWAGLIAGIAFVLAETTLTSLFTGGPDADAVRRIAAIALGETVLPPPTPFTALVFVAAMSVHLPLSLLYARILAALVRGLDAGRAAAAGASFGAILYAVNYYVFTEIFPWFAPARGWITLTSHVVFGVLAAWTYVELAGRSARRSGRQRTWTTALRNISRPTAALR